MIDTDRYEIYEELILSDQISSDELERLMADNPEFVKWFQERSDARASRQFRGFNANDNT